MIVGTAGHIDHGKTSLVRALTGVDTDRLKEEKARGISIELGYAYVPVASASLTDDEVLGFIDVPGHERLVHTMVAGAGGIDFALLVIAADDGVMPQTREHLAILGLLGIARGAVALSKCDRVDEARIETVRAEITALLRPTPLCDAPIFPLDATTPGDPGVAALRAHLESMARAAPQRRDDDLFRLAVDRVFTLAGHGTVVTGTVHAGRVRVGDTCTAMPAAMAVRVRSIHAQNQAAQSGRAGQRCALNLAGVDKNALARGDWIADPRAFAPTSRIDVRLHRLGDAPVPLPNWAPLHIHLGTLHQLAHVVALEPVDASSDDGSQRVQLVFDTPVCATPGDHFIARDAQAAHTIGGGIVIDPYAPARKRRSPQRRAWLDAIEHLLAGGGIDALLQTAAHGVGIDDLVRLTGHAADQIVLPHDARAIDTSRGRFIVDAARWAALCERVLAALRDFHAQAADEPGVDSGRLRRMAMPGTPDALWRALVDELAHEQAVLRNGPWLHLPGHRVSLTASERALAGKLQPLIASARFDPPWLRELATAVNAPEDEVRKTLRVCVTQGMLHQIVRDLFYARESVRELADILRSVAEKHGAVEAAQYRDAVGLGRKRTIQILEFFDRVGYTRRVRDAHVLRADSGWRIDG
ncbi:MAG: selenocysteine-specific translation elongation factor [Dokdonella sp.]